MKTKSNDARPWMVSGGSRVGNTGKLRPEVAECSSQKAADEVEEGDGPWPLRVSQLPNGERLGGERAFRFN